MLNTFPILLSFAFFVPFVFRIAIAMFLFALVRSIGDKVLLTNYFVANKYPAARILAPIYQIALIGSGLLIGIGLFTQIASLIAIYLVITLGHINKEVRFSKHGLSTFNFVALICFSLLFLGAGAVAFDYPL